jgi:hypothetical protein
MIDKSGAVSHISRINGTLWTPKVIERVINTQTFPQNIDTVLDKLPTINH